MQSGNKIPIQKASETCTHTPESAAGVFTGECSTSLLTFSYPSKRSRHLLRSPRKRKTNRKEKDVSHFIGEKNQSAGHPRRKALTQTRDSKQSTEQTRKSGGGCPRNPEPQGAAPRQAAGRPQRGGTAQGNP